ncbi:hypothetical protein F66182_8833 [Fusarium sp. NRRL 66182]|nr:hypothetical protein F66182_8833 [Fusarium sp. NRRL 66182]
MHGMQLLLAAPPVFYREHKEPTNASPTREVNAEEYSDHCKIRLTETLEYCGSITYRHTLVRPAFYLLYIQSKRRTPATRIYFWERDIDAICRMESEHKDEWPWSCPRCNFSGENNNLHDAHGYELVTEQKQGVCWDSIASSPVFQSHEPMGQSTQNETDFKPADSPLSSLPIPGEDESTQVRIVNDSLATLNSHLGSPVVSSTAES